MNPLDNVIYGNSITSMSGRAAQDPVPSVPTNLHFDIWVDHGIKMEDYIFQKVSSQMINWADVSVCR